MSTLSTQTLQVDGATLALLPEHAVWWPAQRTLCVADLHLGKAATFRAHGLPVPAGTTGDNLQRLTALVRQHAAQRIVFLGDYLHAASARHPEVLAQAHAWRMQHPELECVLVRGNHDQHAGDPPATLRITVVDEPWPLAPGLPLRACHHPQAVAGHTVLAGHWHPATVLRGPARDRQRLPCFSHTPGLLVLPAFGAFTGTSAAPLPDGARLYVVGGGRVWPPVVHQLG
jgi:DNA ligase-associated metallophosphoesterase